MLKHSPFIDELCLYDTKSLEGFANDLNYIDTKCRVTAYYGNKDIQKALTVSYKMKNKYNFFFPEIKHHSDAFVLSHL